MAEIMPSVYVGEAIRLCGNVQHNKKKSESLIKCLQAVKAPLQSIDDAERDRIQVSHEETLALLKEVIDRAHALLQKQTRAQNYVLKAVRSANVRDQFHEIQIALQGHLQTLTLSVGVLSGVKMQESLKIIEQVNGEALKEHLDELRENQNIMQGNQRDILENQSTTHDNQRDILSRADDDALREREMKSVGGDEKYVGHPCSKPAQRVRKRGQHVHHQRSFDDDHEQHQQRHKQLPGPEVERLGFGLQSDN